MAHDHVDVLSCRERGPERRPLELDVPDGVVLPVPAHAGETAEERAVLVPARFVESQEVAGALDVDRPRGPGGGEVRRSRWGREEGCGADGGDGHPPAG